MAIVWVTSSALVMDFNHIGLLHLMALYGKARLMTANQRVSIYKMSSWIPEQRLWQACILNAVHEACNEAWRNKLQKKQALSWFQGGKDFKMVCDYAGWNESYVKNKFWEMYLTKQLAKSHMRHRAYPDKIKR